MIPFYFFFSIYILTVPSSPLELEYVNLTSTAIQVTWMPPADPNGIVESYILMLTFEANGTSNNVTNILVTTYNVTGLMPYQEYTVVVYAMTDKGPGSGSVPLNVLTDEDSKLTMILKSSKLVLSYALHDTDNNAIKSMGELTAIVALFPYSLCMLAFLSTSNLARKYPQKLATFRLLGCKAGGSLEPR